MHDTGPPTGEDLDLKGHEKSETEPKKPEDDIECIDTRDISENVSGGGGGLKRSASRAAVDSVSTDKVSEGGSLMPPLEGEFDSDAEDLEEIGGADAEVMGMMEDEDLMEDGELETLEEEEEIPYRGKIPNHPVTLI